MKTKKQIGKKALSVFLAVMMLMSAWVFVAPEAEAVAAATIKSTNEAALATITGGETSVKNYIYGSFPNEDSFLEDEYKSKVYKNVLYSPACTSETVATSEQTFYSGTFYTNYVTGAWFNATTTLVYDGTVPQTGVLMRMTGRYKGVGGNNKVRLLSGYVASGGQGLEFDSAWHGSDGKENFNYAYWAYTINSDYTDKAAAWTYDAIDGYAWTKEKTVYYANVLKFNGDESNFGNEYYIDATPTFGFYATNSSGDISARATATTTNHIYVINIIPWNTAISQALKVYSELTKYPEKYTTASVAKYCELATNLLKANANNYITSSSNNVTGWNTAAKAAVSAWNAWAKTGLTIKAEDGTYVDTGLALQKYTVQFDNMFNFNNFNISGNLTVNERTDTGFTVTSTAADGNTGFSDYIPVEPGKTYIFSADVSIQAVSGGYDMYVHTLNENKEGETTATPDTSNGANREGNVYISLTGQTTNKTPYIRFTAGENTRYIRIRFDANAVDNVLTVNNIRVYEDGPSYVEPKSYDYGATLGTLPTPTRTGYTFNGWVDANGNAVSSSTTVTDDTALYSKWTVNQYTITFDTDGGSTIAPITQDYGSAITAPANPTKTDYKFVGWDKTIPSTMPAENMTIKAQWALDKFTVKFVNYDGTVLQSSDFKGGATPIYEGATPTKDSDATNHYTFSGWSPAVVSVTGNATYTAQFTATAHSFGTPAYYDGDTHELKCSCGYAKYEEHGLEKQITDSKAPTCNADGYEEYGKYCPDCKSIYGSGRDTLTATGEHTYTSEVTKKATHLEEGETTYTCACGDTYTEAIAKLTEHTYTSEVTKKATHLEEGETTYTCACGDRYTEAIAKLTEHTYTSEVTKKATHLEEGETTYTCACGDTYTEAIAKLTEHTYTSKVTKAPTCTEKGEKTYTCACGDKYTEEISETGHNMVEGTVVAPTCTADGYTVYTCGNNCGTTENRDAVTKLGHAYGETWTASTESGKHYKDCTRCGKAGRITEACTESNWIISVNATCMEEGSEYKQCTVCTRELKTQKIEKIVHKFEGTVKNSRDGYHVYKCTNLLNTGSFCNEYGAEEACSGGEATCIAPATCTTCNTAYGTKNTANHKNTTEYVEKAATCLETGYTAGVFCEDCKKWISGHEEIPAIAHKNKVHHEKVDATCRATGTIEYWSCPNCGKNFSDEACTAEVTNLTIEINPDKHDLKTVEAQAPTCTEIGWDEYEFCQREGCDYTTYIEKGKLGHLDENKDHACDRNCGVAQGEHIDSDKNHICDYGCTETIGTCVDADKDHDCDYGCDAVYGTCEDKDLDHDCDYGCGQAYGEHVDSDKNHTCDYGCAETIGTCADADKDHDCDYGCDKVYGTCEDKDFDHDCDYGCDKVYGTCEDNDFDHDCDYGCDAVHGTCEDKDLDHACDYGCDKVYGTCEDKDLDHACDYGCDAVHGTCEDKDLDHACDYGCDKVYGTCEDKDLDHACDYGCDKVYGTCEDKDLDHDCDYGCDKVYGTCEDKDLDHDCDYGCDAVYGTCEDKDLDHDCDYGCDTVYGTCEDKDLDHACDYGCDKVYGTCEDKDKDHDCDYGCNKVYGTCEDADKDHTCDYGCGQAYGEHVDSDKNHACDYGCSVAIGTCADADKDHDCDYGCNKVYGKHEDTNKDHKCDYGCAETIGTCADADKDHDCDYGCDKIYGEHVDADKNHTCDYGCAEKIGTCEDKNKDHICDYGCGKEYGKHEDSDKNHVCDYGCTVNFGEHKDSATDNDHLCDYGCGAVLEACLDKTGDGNHKCDICGEDNITTHVKGEEKRENVTEATCGSAGKYDSVYYCTECNTVVERTNDVTIAQKPHNWQDATYSWTADGKSCTATRVCANNADHTETETVNATGAQKVAPTCENMGSTLYSANFEATWAAEQANEVFDIPSLGHDMVTDAAVAATCTETGLTEGSHCSRCNGATTAQVVIPATGHDYEGVVTKNPTCTEKGEKTYTCKNDASHTYKEEVAANGHTLTQVTAKAPTCTEDGYKAYEYCSVCTYTTYEVDPATGHNHNATVTAPTCTEAGYTTYTCACGDTYKADEVPSTGHTTVTDAAVAPTCTATGLTEGSHCSACNEVFVAQEEIKALGHEEIEHAAQNPTCSVAGWEAYVTCSRCDYSTKVEIPADESLHAWEVTQTGKATCTQGYDIIYTCMVCGATMTEAVPAAGHKYEYTVKEVHPTCTETGTKTTTGKCSVCEDETVETVTLAVLAHERRTMPGVAATCTTEGFTDYVYCNRCGLVLEEATTIPVVDCEDNNHDGFCDYCYDTLRVNADGTKCNCVCHKQNGLMKFIYSILRFFWKLFGISRTCCEAGVHY